MYQVLQNSRAIGFSSIWYIPLTEIVAVLNLYQIEELKWRIYYTMLLQSLDQAYVKWWSDKHGSKEGKK